MPQLSKFELRTLYAIKLDWLNEIIYTWSGRLSVVFDEEKFRKFPSDKYITFIDTETKDKIVLPFSKKICSLIDFLTNMSSEEWWKEQESNIPYRSLTEHSANVEVEEKSVFESMASPLDG